MPCWQVPGDWWAGRLFFHDTAMATPVWAACTLSAASPMGGNDQPPGTCSWPGMNPPRPTASPPATVALLGPTSPRSLIEVVTSCPCRPGSGACQLVLNMIALRRTRGYTFRGHGGSESYGQDRGLRDRRIAAGRRAVEANVNFKPFRRGVGTVLRLGLAGISSDPAEYSGNKKTAMPVAGQQSQVAL